MKNLSLLGFQISPDEFIKLLNLCNDVLHVWNPYSPRERKVDFEIPILEWVQKIQWLLDIHYMQLADSEEIWLVMMSAEDGKVHAYLANGANAEPENPSVIVAHASAGG